MGQKICLVCTKDSECTMECRNVPYVQSCFDFTLDEEKALVTSTEVPDPEIV